MRRCVFFIVFLLFWLFFVGAGECKLYEYMRLFRDPVTMGAGDTGVAGLASSTAVFYNPAGLSLLEKRYGWEVRLLDVNLAESEKLGGLYWDVKDALDSGDTLEMFDVFRRHIGDIYAMEANILASLAKKYGIKGYDVAFTAGAFGRISTDGVIHNGFGSFGLVDLKSYSFMGYYFGLGTSFWKKRLHLGFDMKDIYASMYDHELRASEIVSHVDNLMSYLEGKIVHGRKRVFDLGLIFSPFENKTVSPVFGISVMNVGGFKVDTENSGEILILPMSVNMGFGVKINKPLNEYWGFKFFKDTRFECDLVDVFGEQGGDLLKRLHLGASTKIVDRRLLTIAVGSGLYQGYPSFGISFRFLILEGRFVTYAEEVGAVAGQAGDRRYLLNLAIKW